MEPVVALPSNPVDELARLRALAVEKANLRNQLKYRILGQLATNGSLDKTALETQFIEKLSLYKLRKDALVADKDKIELSREQKRTVEAEFPVWEASMAEATAKKAGLKKDRDVAEYNFFRALSALSACLQRSDCLKSNIDIIEIQTAAVYDQCISMLTDLSYPSTNHNLGGSFTPNDANFAEDVEILDKDKLFAIHSAMDTIRVKEMTDHKTMMEYDPIIPVPHLNMIHKKAWHEFEEQPSANGSVPQPAPPTPTPMSPAYLAYLDHVATIPMPSKTQAEVTPPAQSKHVHAPTPSVVDTGPKKKNKDKPKKDEHHKKKGFLGLFK